MEPSCISGLPQHTHFHTLHFTFHMCSHPPGLESLQLVTTSRPHHHHAGLPSIMQRMACSAFFEARHPPCCLCRVFTCFCTPPVTACPITEAAQHVSCICTAHSARPVNHTLCGCFCCITRCETQDGPCCVGFAAAGSPCFGNGDVTVISSTTGQPFLWDGSYPHHTTSPQQHPFLPCPGSSPVLQWAGSLKQSLHGSGCADILSLSGFPCLYVRVRCCHCANIRVGGRGQVSWLCGFAATVVPVLGKRVVITGTYPRSTVEGCYLLQVGQLQSFGGHPSLLPSNTLTAFGLHNIRCARRLCAQCWG